MADLGVFFEKNGLGPLGVNLDWQRAFPLVYMQVDDGIKVCKCHYCV
jgi:hypothetical protein